MNEQPGRILVLGSSSIYRRRLLQNLGLPFKTLSPDVDESPMPGELPADMARRLATLKAQYAATRFPDALVIGADQVGMLGTRWIGKPADHAEAVAQLTAASGRRMVLYTGIALLDARSGRLQQDVVPFEVEFRELDPRLIERYLRAEKPYDCCGSVRAEGMGIALLRSLRGDDPNALIGLPLIRLIDMLQREGIVVPPRDGSREHLL